VPFFPLTAPSPFLKRDQSVRRRQPFGVTVILRRNSLRAPRWFKTPNFPLWSTPQSLSGCGKNCFESSPPPLLGTTFYCVSPFPATIFQSLMGICWFPRPPTFPLFFFPPCFTSHSLSNSFVKFRFFTPPLLWRRGFFPPPSTLFYPHFGFPLFLSFLKGPAFPRTQSLPGFFHHLFRGIFFVSFPPPGRALQPRFSYFVVPPG